MSALEYTPATAMVVVAHPDDAELLAGGTLAKAVDAGRRVGILDLTHGEMGSRGNAEIRARESAAASLVKEWRVTLEAAVKTKAAPVSLIDELRKRREQRSAS